MNALMHRTSGTGKFATTSLIIGVSLVLLLFLVAPAAATLFRATVTSGGQTYSQTFAKAEDLVNDIKVANIQRYLPAYTDTSAVTGTLAFRGLSIVLNYAASSNTLVLNVPAIGLTETFAGATRDQSIELLKDWFTKSGSDAVEKLMRSLAETTPNDPIAGNPASLTTVMATNTFSMGFVDKVSTLIPPTEIPVAVTRDQNINANYISFQPSFSSFSNDQARINSYVLPFAYTFRSNQDERRRFRISLPVSLNRFDSATSFTAGIGLAMSFPLTTPRSPHQWVLTPSLDYNVAASLDMYSGGTVWQGGVTSSYAYNFGKYRIGLGNMIAYQQALPITVGEVKIDPGVKNTVFRNGLMFSFPTDVLVTGTSMECFFIDTRFTGTKLFSDYYHEFGIAWGLVKAGSEGKTVKGSKIIRNYLAGVKVGASYLTSRDNQGFSLNLGFVF